MIVDKHGCAVKVEGSVEATREEVERARDLLMLAVAGSGASRKTIARLFNCSERTVFRRLKAVPPEAREYYGRSLGKLGVALAGRRP